MVTNYMGLVLIVVSYSDGANILAIVPTPSYSHQIAYTHVWKELSLRGHKVTLITTDPLKDPKLTNLTEIDMKWTYSFASNIKEIVEDTLTMWNLYDVNLDITLKVAEALLSHYAVQDLLQHRTNFDVVLVEFFYPELLAFAEIYGCPKILISSLDTNPYFHKKMGNPSHPALHPDFATPFFGTLNFRERIISALFTLYLSIFYEYKIIPEKQKLLNKYFGTAKSVEELVDDVDMIFLNVNPVIQGSKALGPTTINTGNQRPAISTEPLPVKYNMFVNYIGCVLYLASYSHSADILAIIPFPSYSHQIASKQLWKELSLRGHKVTLITTDPLKDPTLTNLTEINTNWSYKIVSDISYMAENTLSMWNTYEGILNQMLEISEQQLSYSPVKDLINTHSHFDVVFSEFIYPEFLGFAEMYNCPKILISSLEANNYFHIKMGNPSHPILHPDMVTPFYGQLNFQERVISTLFSLYVLYFYNYRMMPEKQKILHKHFNTTKPIQKLVSDVDILFLNVNPVIQTPRALGPTTINFGHRRPISSKPLPKDLAEFLDSAKDGFIYFSLGSNVKSKDLKKDSLKAIIESLAEVPYKVLWKFEADTLPGKPDNVKLVKWAPQQNVLGK
ncbi:hypothetical protein NQ314_008484 [Rhamnusium bicolor]|uniref:UDP-glycosyltransferase n=1 Tax=Rhamnusium bicolor TaxID=1586634 RepID=A0AAV8Y905_9CUCU|nr:hypothetical protein NQ314_008484 [Rhamnusium bicolor]